MKKILLISAFLIIGHSFCFSQTADSTKKETINVQVYLDEHGNKIDEKKFFDLIAGAQYSFHAKMENGKPVGLQLEKKEKALHLMSSAPNFLVSDINGKMYKLSDLKGKIVVLNFWFTACVPCIEEMPELNKLTEKYKDNADIIFLAITYDPAEKVKNFLSKNAFNYPVATGQKALIEQYGIAGYPTNIVLDKNGKVGFLLTAYSSDNVKKLDTAIGSIAKL